MGELSILPKTMATPRVVSNSWQNKIIDIVIGTPNIAPKRLKYPNYSYKSEIGTLMISFIVVLNNWMLHLSGVRLHCVLCLSIVRFI